MKTSEVESQLGVSVAGTIPPAPEAFHELARMGAAPLVTAKPAELAANTLVDLTRWLAEKLPVTQR